MKKIFISGSRFGDMKKVKKFLYNMLSSYIDNNEYIKILVGDCYGVDSIVRNICLDLDIDFNIYYINNCRCNLYDNGIKVKGYNFIDKDIVMSKECDLGYVFWNGNSRGSKNNIDRLNKLEKEVIVIRI